MDIDEAIRGRRSVREYTGQDVDEQSIHRLIEAAVQAPSAVNQQPWSFTVVRDRRLLDRLSQAAKKHLLASPQSDRFRSLLEDEKFHIFYHAPVLILVSATSEGPWVVEDCAMAAQNLMLSAFGAGLGTCWIGFAQRFLETPEGKTLLGLPQSGVPVAPIILGHPRAAVPPVPRDLPKVRWVG